MGNRKRIIYTALALLPLGSVACSKVEKPVANEPVYELAGGCYAVSTQDGRFLGEGGASYAFAVESAGEAAAFRLQPSDLGHYVLYDRERNYLAAKRGAKAGPWKLLRTDRKADVRIPHHQRFSDAEWAVETKAGTTSPYLLRHLNSKLYLGQGGLVSAEDALELKFVEQQNCSAYPELPLDAGGTVRSEPWPDGQVYGMADSHSHIMTNLGFGGGGIFHGAPFHRLGVEHALEDCDEVHGPEGRRDIVGYFMSGGGDLDMSLITDVLVNGSLSVYNHDTAGYPKFTSWPNAEYSYTHQTQYYRWIERAWLSGLRLVFQHATGNSGLCEFMVGLGAGVAPYTCNDMVSVDRTIEETRAMERYIDARSGGPGRGWFRIVNTPEEARAEINKGNLAVVLGIEISNIFDCFLTPPPGAPKCTVEHVKEQVRRYYEKGVRVVFPVHKYDNGFSAGDGHRGIIELGNVINSGHMSNYTLDCPDIEHNFDRGDVVFGGLNVPRDDYFSRPLLDVSRLTEEPLMTLLPIVPGLAQPRLEGEYCQAAGLTDLGKTLIRELMKYGMIIDIAHLPKWSTVQALEIFEENDYPAISTHGQNYDGRLYRTGGLSKSGFGTCGDPETPGTMAAGFLAKARDVQEANGLPAQPLGFDLNGFAGGRGPRFGPNSVCSTAQANPVTWPFKSYDGQVTFEQPTLGERIIDFNETGMLHIGLLPELIEDVRRDGGSDDDLEPLFRSAEALLQVWEAIEAAAK